MSDKIGFQSTMTKFNVNVKKDNIFTCFTLQVMEDSTVRSFPCQFKSINLGVFDSMANNDVFDKINVPCEEYNIEYVVDFGELQFDAKIDSINAVIKRRKDGTPYTIYNLNFIKEIDKDIDVKLASFVKYKETDEDGKKKVKFFVTSLKEKEA